MYHSNLQLDLALYLNLQYKNHLPVDKIQSVQFRQGQHQLYHLAFPANELHRTKYMHKNEDLYFHMI